MARRYVPFRTRQKGDTINVNWTHCYGFITRSGKDLNIVLPTAFLVSPDVTTATFNGKMQARQNGVYLYGNSACPADVDPIKFDFGNMFQATYSFDVAPAGVTNNDTVAITLSNGTITFS